MPVFWVFSEKRPKKPRIQERRENPCLEGLFLFFCRRQKNKKSPRFFPVSFFEKFGPEGAKFFKKETGKNLGLFSKNAEGIFWKKPRIFSERKNRDYGLTRRGRGFKKWIKKFCEAKFFWSILLKAPSVNTKWTGGAACHFFGKKNGVLGRILGYFWGFWGITWNIFCGAKNFHVMRVTQRFRGP